MIPLGPHPVWEPVCSIESLDVIRAVCGGEERVEVVDTRVSNVLISLSPDSAQSLADQLYGKADEVPFRADVGEWLSGPGR